MSQGGGSKRLYWKAIERTLPDEEDRIWGIKLTAQGLKKDNQEPAQRSEEEKHDEKTSE